MLHYMVRLYFPLPLSCIVCTIIAESQLFSFYVAISIALNRARERVRESSDHIFTLYFLTATVSIVEYNASGEFGNTERCPQWMDFQDGDVYAEITLIFGRVPINIRMRTAN